MVLQPIWTVRLTKRLWDMKQERVINNKEWEGERRLKQENTA